LTFFQNIEYLSSCQGGSPKVWKKKCAEKRAFSVRKSSWITFTRHRSVSQMAHFNHAESSSLTPRDTQGKIRFKYWTFSNRCEAADREIRQGAPLFRGFSLNGEWGTCRFGCSHVVQAHFWCFPLAYRTRPEI